MGAEFADLASWTADAALQLGPGYYVPAGCRGSGGPRTLDLLLDGLHLARGAVLLDVGAGVGGPAAYAAASRGLRLMAVEPEVPACRSMARLFGSNEHTVDVVAGNALALPFADGVFAAAWCLGVLCTVDDHTALLTELRRVIAPGGRIALLVFVARDELPERPSGNTFPTEASLRAAIEAAGLQLEQVQDMVPEADEDADWRRLAAAVDDAVKLAHGQERAWREADEQSRVIGRLLAARDLVGRVVHLTR